MKTIVTFTICVEGDRQKILEASDSISHDLPRLFILAGLKAERACYSQPEEIEKNESNPKH